MAVPVSSLSVAIQGLAEFMSSKFTEDVLITVDTPQKAQEQAKELSAQILNIFVYRIVPSGFHASEGHQDPFFVRANVLLTAFPSGQGTPPPDVDLRVLGHALRVLQSFPVIPVTLPGAAPANATEADFRKETTTDYQLQVVLQAPTMEDMNHIWTTQGGELAYRLSASYELALIPIEPITHADEAPDVTATELILAPGTQPRPFLMFQRNGRLFSHVSVSPGTGQARLSLTGVPDSHVSLRVEWTRHGGAIERQSPQIVPIKTRTVESPDAGVDLILIGAADGDTASVIAVPSNDKGVALKDWSLSNPIELSVEAP